MAEFPKWLEADTVMFLFCSPGVKRGAPRQRPFPQSVTGGRAGAGHRAALRRRTARGGDENNIRRLVCLQGVLCMGLVESKRPVVLIVEDEFLLRMDAVDMIAAAGFEVLEAGNADKAIEILEARRDITVVFTDIQMPGSMDGLKLARAVRGRWPPVKIVATSALDVRETELPEGGRFLPKPYSPFQVTGVLRELTGA